ncbi:methyltransferase [Virgisporangium aliadipatigenens]|uniref:Methyltransferase n=1 Tax=Virgisporangium aliadipatigenens TaxID=741659 RepID=A0A8J4DWD6_9ACTN|nr:methyltransferase [Virgisporangium aliadipatigenens]GIJ52406.1 methyltransferase [Virgisporangium aliadipatigenens]
MTEALLSPAGIDRLRDALLSAGYTDDGIAARLGPEAVDAVRRNDFRPALRATEGGEPVDTLIRLFVCGQTEPEAAIRAALPEEARRVLVEDNRAAVELEPYGDWWVVSDVSASLRPGVPLPAEHVLGIGGASTTLAQATWRRPVGRALDLGTGCGVQALHLSQHAEAVTATDLSGRALTFAATTAALSGVSWDLRQGDLVRPVAGERFDLVVSNPPFVAGPGTTTHTYRDSGRAGDAVCAELVAAAPALLNPRGTMQFLANWLLTADEEWEDRVAGWLAGTGLDAWVIQREVSDPVAYVDLWLADSGTTDPRTRARWLDWFEENGVTGVGLGLITLRAGGHEDPTVRLEELRQPVEQPLGRHVGRWFERQDWLRSHDKEGLLKARLTTAPDLALRQDAHRGPDGWEVDRQQLALTGGLHWAEEVDPVALALVGGCDGTVALRDQLDLLALAHGVDVAVLAEVAVPLVSHLVERGFLLPAEETQ